MNEVCSSGSDSETDRKSAATQGSAHSCCQPFDSAHFTSQEPAAWAVWHRSEDAPGRVAYASAIQSIRGTGEMRDGEEFIPLYGKPTLTESEREVLSAILYRHRAAEGPEIRTIRDLLARLS